MGQKEGPPGEGFLVRLSRRASKAGVSQFETIAEERTGPDGVADLGLVPPGKYVLLATGGTVNCEWFTTWVNVLPGSTQTVEIVCPPAKIEKVDVVIRVEVPEDLRESDLYLTTELVLGPRDFSGSEWRSGFNGTEANDALAIVIIAPDGRVALTYQGIMSHSNNAEPVQMLPSDANGQDFASFEERPLKLFATDHYLRTIRIGSGIGSRAGQTAAPSMVAIKSEWHFLPEKKRIYPGVFLDYRIANRDLALLQKFKAPVGKDTEWRITVPNEFWTQARTDLERADRISQQTPPNPIEPVSTF